MDESTENTDLNKRTIDTRGVGRGFPIIPLPPNEAWSRTIPLIDGKHFWKQNDFKSNMIFS